MTLFCVQLSNSVASVGTGVSQAHQQLQEVLDKKQMEHVCLHLGIAFTYLFIYFILCI